MNRDDSGPNDETTDWEVAWAGDVPDTPVDHDVIDLADALAPGTALDLGCGSGQNSIWLAQHGWTVHGVDIAAAALKRARSAAERAGANATFEKADLTTWRTPHRFDLVLSTYALPPRGPGRVHALTTAREAVAPGGTVLIAEFDHSLADTGWMAAEDLVTLEEITGMLPGFHLVRAQVHVTAHTHGEETNELPIVIVVARPPGSLTQEA